jgi:WD repeat-containing protein 35
VKGVLLDEIMMDPDQLDPKELFVSYETRSLRDTKALLDQGGTVDMKDAFSFIEKNPHQRLHRYLAEAALNKLDFNLAEKAFVKCSDFQGIQFLKRLKVLDVNLPKKNLKIF